VSEYLAIAWSCKNHVPGSQFESRTTGLRNVIENDYSPAEDTQFLTTELWKLIINGVIYH